jgi:hypothetical protein
MKRAAGSWPAARMALLSATARRHRRGIARGHRCAALAARRRTARRWTTARGRCTAFSPATGATAPAAGCQERRQGQPQAEFFQKHDTTSSRSRRMTGERPIRADNDPPTIVRQPACRCGRTMRRNNIKDFKVATAMDASCPTPAPLTAVCQAPAFIHSRTMAQPMQRSTLPGAAFRGSDSRVLPAAQTVGEATPSRVSASA